MAETVEGGVYKVGDEWQDANGNKIDAPKANHAEVEEGPDGEDHPYASLLAENGYEEWEAVVDAPDDDLLAIEGIGPKRLAEIRAHKG